MTDILINTTAKITFVLVNSSGVEVTGLGATFTVQISKNGGAFAASSGTKAEISDGWYSYTFAAGETDTAGPLAVKVTGAGAAQQNLLYEVVGTAQVNVITVPTVDQVAQVRRMTAEPTTTTYSDDTIEAYIAKYPLMDPLGNKPYEWDYSSTPPSQDANEDWIPTYDLHAAAGDIWEEKAGAVFSRFDFSADGGNYSRSQEYENAMKQARYHRSRRSPTTMTFMPYAEDNASLSWIGNLPEPD